MKKAYRNLSDEAHRLLKDPIVYERLSKITKAIGVTPEEYLIRFEEVLSENPHSINSTFEEAYFKA